MVASHLSVVTRDPPAQEVSKAGWAGLVGQYRLLPNGWTFTVELREAMGSETHLHCDLPGWTPPAAVLSVRRDAASGPAEDGKRSRLVARVSRRSRAREGDPLELAVDTSALHFFDRGPASD
jgi:ABC-type sugar transport system ATPase subunit